MSQPIKRFRCLTNEENKEFDGKHIRPGLVMCDDGNLVSYKEHCDIVADKDIHIKVLDDEVVCVREENAALAAENERLRAIIQSTIDGSYVRYTDYAALAAENERLKSRLSMSQAIAEACGEPQVDGAITVKTATSTGKTVLPDPAAKEGRDAK